MRLAASPQTLAALVQASREVLAGNKVHLPGISVGILHDLYRTLFTELGAELEGIDHLFFVPHGVQSGVSLAALIDAPPPRPVMTAQESRKVKLGWLVRRFSVSVVPSPASISLLRKVIVPSQATRPSWAWEIRCSVLASAHFQAQRQKFTVLRRASAWRGRRIS